MTQVRWGQFLATLDGRRWTCSEPSMERFLRLYTESIAIHGGVPDAEQYIVLQLQKRFREIKVISRPPPPETDVPEGVY